MKETLLNAVERRGPGTPVRLASEDFEVFRRELRTQAATVVMVDMSRSMLNNGSFLRAKKVALALAALIRGQSPRDALYIVGFSPLRPGVQGGPASHPVLERVERGDQRINRGRAFFTAAHRLGEYMLVDFVTSRRRAA
jgi:uncharacterized protein with von Willebrand factor type A (vWA) domain